MEQPDSTASARRLTPPGYRSRAVDARLDALMRAFGAVEIVGPKWCGKTWTALAHAASLTELDRPSEREAAQIDPNLALLGAAPHLVDEWQEVPEVWDASRRFIDDAAGRTGLLLLTGSVALSPRQRERVHHSGAGRIARIMMRPFSLHETGLSDGTVSLLDLFEGKGFAPFRCEVSLSDIAEWCCRGGWPAALALDAADACEVPANYVQAMLDVDVPTGGASGDRPQRPRGCRSKDGWRGLTGRVYMRTLRPLSCTWRDGADSKNGQTKKIVLRSCGSQR